jgi:glycosyltransferase involved in cell wall biosynthesis
MESVKERNERMGVNMSLKNPLISVLIPTYNRAKYIKQAIDSVVAQDYRPIEIIIIDDGSTDDTKEIIEQNYDKNIVRYFYQKNKGIPRARNACLAKAKGEYIAWLDSDDYYLPGKLTAQMNYMREHPDCEIVFAKCKHFIEDKKLLRNACLYNLIKREKTYSASLCLVSSLAKRNIYDKCKFDERYIEGEDNHILMDMKLIHGISLKYCLKNKVFCRRIHAKNTMNSGETRKKIVRSTIYNDLKKIIKNKNMFLISIVIPVKNGSNYLQEAIEGIKKQNMNVEIIVVDDGSTDNTAKIAEKMGCIVIKNPKNLGQDISKNIGLKHAKGDFILFHDHDDVMRENVLIKMHKEFELDKDLQVVMAKLKDFVSPELKGKKIPFKREAYHGALAGAVLFKREVFNIIGNFDENINVGGLDILLRLEKYDIKTKRINIIAVNRRIHSTNYSRMCKQREYKDYMTVLKSRLLKK